MNSLIWNKRNNGRPRTVRQIANIQGKEQKSPPHSWKGDKGQSSGLFINGKKEHKNFYLSGGTIKLQCINVILDRQQTSKRRFRWCFFCAENTVICARPSFIFWARKCWRRKFSFLFAKKSHILFQSCPLCTFAGPDNFGFVSFFIYHSIFFSLKNLHITTHRFDTHKVAFEFLTAVSSA